VVLCDYRGLGQMVTSTDLDALRRLNLGYRTLRHPLVPDLILREIERYDARDAAEVSRRVREEASLEPALDRLVALYEEVIAEQEREGPVDPAEESRAAAVYLHDWTGRVPHLENVAAERQRLDKRVRELEAELRQPRLDPRVLELDEELRATRLERDRLAETLRAVTGTVLWRLREKLMRFPGLQTAWQKIRRLGRGAGQRG
jgi:predicted RNase H-like nuclease (RuvC/YqgF family)